MIAYLKGTIKFKDENYAILIAHDVGYKVYLGLSFLSELILGSEIEIYTHQHIREDALDLYRFRSLEELEIFELLISVSGIGPKTALGVLAAGSMDEIRSSISRGDSHLLTKVSGIGHKTAERVILELRDKIGSLKLSTVTQMTAPGVPTSGDEIDALVALGYSLNDARDALRQVDPQTKNFSDRIREALKKLGK